MSLLKRRLARLEAAVGAAPTPPPPAEPREVGLARAERRLRTVHGRLEGRLAPGEFEPADLPLLTAGDKRFIDTYMPTFEMMKRGNDGYFATHGFWPWEWREKHAAEVATA